MTHLKAFGSGFLATLIFHQGVWTLFYVTGTSQLAPYSMEPTWPLQIPRVISLAFWGGVWAVVLWPLIRPNTSWRYWVVALALGALGPSIVALCIVFPLKGMPMGGGWEAKAWVGAFLLNGAWGIGVALFMRLFDRRSGTGAA